MLCNLNLRSMSPDRQKWDLQLVTQQWESSASEAGLSFQVFGIKTLKVFLSFDPFTSWKRVNLPVVLLLCNTDQSLHWVELDWSEEPLQSFRWNIARLLKWSFIPPKVFFPPSPTKRFTFPFTFVGDVYKRLSNGCRPPIWISCTG